MKKWLVVTVLALSQFVMVLDSTVMNVSISTVVKDLGTSVTALQACITFYTLTMAALMLLGAKLGDVWGRKKTFVVGSIIYACGSFITALSANVTQLFIGWSVIEGIGAVLVIPAIAALIANNYSGKMRVTAFAIIGAVSGAAMAAGPLIGGFMTTYLSWRYVFFGEVVIMAITLLFRNKLIDKPVTSKVRIDAWSVILSAVGMVLLVLGMLQSKTWGWVQPMKVPEIAGYAIKPLGISIVAYLILVGVILLRVFYTRQQKLLKEGGAPLLDVSMFSVAALRSGLGVLMAQYTMIASIFFIIPVYLQMTLGYDALKTGIKIFPLSIGLILFSIIGTKLSSRWSPKKIIRVGQYILIVSSLMMLSAVSATLKGWLFGTAMFCVGGALGLLSSQIGNVNMTAVDAKKSSEVGGLQGAFQNFGSSLGTALIGSVLIASLTSVFVTHLNASDLSPEVKTTLTQKTEYGVAILPVSEVEAGAKEAGLSDEDTQTLTDLYAESQLEALNTALYALVFIAVVSLLFAKNIPDKIIK